MATAALDPTDYPLGLDASVAARMIDMMSIPAAIVGLGNGAVIASATNIAFRRAGFGVVNGRARLLTALGERIEAFLASGERQSAFAHAHGEAIDCRFFQVTLSRSSPMVRDECIVMLVDQTAQHLSERSLRREMKTDALTGLPNREGFGDLIEQAMVGGRHHAVLVVDLHRFGQLNACMGSLVGDELLITVARRIKGALRGRDTLGRIGGDEFGILMAIDDHAEEAQILAERIQRAFAAPFRLTDYEISVEGAVGIAYGFEGDDDAEEMIRHAQFAVKRAKESGRSEVYQPAAFTIARAQFAMETELRHAVEEKRLRLHYQPICDLASGRITKFEALARWRTQDGREISPTEFIPVAEESGLIVPLGRWAIEEAASTLAGWDRAAGGNSGVRMAVNLSAIQLQRDTVVDVIERTLTAAGLTGDRFTLELTESVMVSDPDRIADTMLALKGLGATLALDDFGTGYSNLAYLQKLPIDILKIDRSFVTGMLADRDKLAIVRAILGLAQALGMRTTAEGVETIELGQTLGALGCNYGQGYVYARPLDAAAAWSMLVERNA